MGQIINLFIGDLHHDDADFRRPDIVGRTGERCFKVLLAWCARLSDMGFSVVLHLVGDTFNNVPGLAEALIVSEDIITSVCWKRKAPHAVLMAGNHDIRLQHCSYLGYSGLIEMYSHPLKMWYEHGHRLDPIWRNPGRFKAWFGESIIKAGAKLEKKWPLIDEAMIRIAKGASRFILPKGARLGDEQYLNEAAKVAAGFMNIEVFLFQHTHRAMLQSQPWQIANSGMNGTVFVVNCGSFVPAGEPHEEGWYAQGEVAPYVYWREAGLLCRILSDGLMVEASHETSLKQKLSDVNFTDIAESMEGISIED